MDFKAVKDAMSPVGIVLGKMFSLFSCFEVQDQQTAGFVSEGAGEDDSAGRMERLQVREMGGSMKFALRFAVGSIVTKDDVFHTCAAGGALLKLIIL
ncbi:MAG TPA: hypothetical protein VJU54_06585 [Nitrospiraceae bacterium]|nr:hypothetical protein [Nitrospiraceae bacterium]